MFTPNTRIKVNIDIPEIESTWKQGKSCHSWSAKSLKCTVVNRKCPSLTRSSLGIKLTVPLIFWHSSQLEGSGIYQGSTRELWNPSSPSPPINRGPGEINEP